MKNSISRSAGKIAQIEFPRALQKALNRLFVHITKIDLQDCAPIDSYRSIQALFTRELRTKRALPEGKRPLISPADSTLLQQGRIRRGQIIHVKGQGYKVSDLLTEQIDQKMVDQLEEGFFMNFYLAPHNYHHFHAPADLKVHKLIHVPGTLSSVKKKCQEKTPDLFVKNERVILDCEMPNKKRCFFIAVGALNVGKIRIKKEPRLQTNLPKKNSISAYEYKTPIEVKRGEDLGHFEMGSSVVLVFEKNAISILNSIQNDQEVQFGEELGEMLY